MSETKRSTLWTVGGKRIGEIAEEVDDDDSQYVLRIFTNLRGKQLIREALVRGEGLVARGPDHAVRVREKIRDDD